DLGHGESVGGWVDGVGVGDGDGDGCDAVRLVPVEDSYVQSTTASTNYGSSSGLLSKPTYGGSPDRIAYFKFDVSAL
ncbi:CBM96 family carbohydrate-binding protein, partial [Enterococcus faecalis]|uniref:CBM96 family carbohydrate-binding protein n=1 Tax=Enterococcus faecalis TaxID=1351 RepID=UPI00403A39FE